MRKHLIVLLTIALVFSLGLVGCGNQTDKDQTGEKKETIVIGVTPWTSTLVPSHIVNLLLTELGYDVKMQNADAGIVYAGLAKGDINVFMDSWLPDTHEDYMNEYGAKIDDVAVSYYEGELGWVVPTYLEDINSIEDLVGNENLFGGRVVGIDEGAGLTATSRELIEEYGLDYNYVTSSEAAMMAQATKEIANEKPILFVGWRPHSMFAMWDLKILEDSKNMFKTQEVHVLASQDLKDRANSAYQFLSSWSISVAEIEEMILLLDENSRLKPEDVAAEWIENNRAKVDSMLGK